MDKPDGDATDRAEQDAEPDFEIDPEAVDDTRRRGNEKHRRADRAGAQGAGRFFAGGHPHEENTGQRAEQTGRGQSQRQKEQAPARTRDRLPLRDGEGRGDGHRGDHGVAVGLEKVGPHAGHIADVVAHVVGDDTGVARVILGNTRLDFADEVGADVGSLGEDAAADAVEDGHQRGAHGEAVDDVHVMLGLAEEDKEPTHAEQTHGGHGQSHDRAAEKRRGQRRTSPAFVRGDGRAHVDVRGGIHADVAGDGRSRRTEEERQRFPGVLEDEQAADNDGEARDEQQFAAHEDHRALVDFAGDFRHASLAAGLRGQVAVDDEGDDQAGDAQ